MIYRAGNFLLLKGNKVIVDDRKKKIVKLLVFTPLTVQLPF